MGVGIGWYLFHAKAAIPPPIERPALRDHLIVVGPDASTLSEPDATIGWTNIVHWTSLNGEALTISFPVSGFPSGTTLPPFADMKLVTDGAGKPAYVFQHPVSASTTSSGKTNDALRQQQTAAHGTLTFVYEQALGARAADGRIIIQW